MALVYIVQQGNSYIPGRESLQLGLTQHFLAHGILAEGRRCLGLATNGLSSPY